MAPGTPGTGEHSKVAEARRRRLPSEGGEVVAEGSEVSRSAGASSMAPGECG